MNLRKVIINNFHSIDSMEIDVYDFTSLIGPNNCGKSTIIRAIEVLLNQSKPSFEEWKNGCEGTPIIIEGLFDEICDWERTTPGIAGIINNGKIRLRVVATFNDGAIETKYEAFIKQYEISGWAEKWGDLSDEIRDIATRIELNAQSWRTKANKEIVRGIILSDKPELTELITEDWTDENISIAPALKQALPKAIVIPAVRDAKEIVKTTSTSVFGTLLNKIIIPAIKEINEYTELNEVIKKLSNRLSGESEEIETVKSLTRDISDRLSTIIESKISITISPPDTEKFLGSNTVIKMNDGTETPINLQGHGAQRALIFALIEVLAKQDALLDNQDIRSSILLFEEPELYLHPHLMRRLKGALMSISQNDNWQVIISTHSPFLIDIVDNPKSLVILSRSSDSAPPKKKQLKTDPFNDLLTSEDERTALRASLDFHPTVNEAFFAQRVVLFEGDTEMALFNHELQLHNVFGIEPKKVDSTTIVSCGGKWTIVPYAKLLTVFDIPFRIVHDEDRKGKTQEELDELKPIHPFNANRKIAEASVGKEVCVIQDTLEHILWLPGETLSSPSKDKPYFTWKKIHEIYSKNPTFDGYEKLKELFHFVYNW